MSNTSRFRIQELDFQDLEERWNKVIDVLKLTQLTDRDYRFLLNLFECSRKKFLRFNSHHRWISRLDRLVERRKMEFLEEDMKEALSASLNNRGAKNSEAEISIKLLVEDIIAYCNISHKAMRSDKFYARSQTPTKETRRNPIEEVEPLLLKKSEESY